VGPQDSSVSYAAAVVVAEGAADDGMR
jgi:hypothetical protein